MCILRVGFWLECYLCDRKAFRETIDGTRPTLKEVREHLHDDSSTWEDPEFWRGCNCSKQLNWNYPGMFDPDEADEYWPVRCKDCTRACRADRDSEVSPVWATDPHVVPPSEMDQIRKKPLKMDLYKYNKNDNDNSDSEDEDEVAIVSDDEPFQYRVEQDATRNRADDDAEYVPHHVYRDRQDHVEEEYVDEYAGFDRIIGSNLAATAIPRLAISETDSQYGIDTVDEEDEVRSVASARTIRPPSRRSQDDRPARERNLHREAEQRRRTYEYLMAQASNDGDEEDFDYWRGQIDDLNREFPI